MVKRHCVGIWWGWGGVAAFSSRSQCCCWTEEEREQVERLRWPSRGYLQELSEYQQRRRQLRKSRCSIMWPPASGALKTRTREKEKRSRKHEISRERNSTGRLWKTLTFDPVTLAHSHLISEIQSGHCGHRRIAFLLVPYDMDPETIYYNNRWRDTKRADVREELKLGGRIWSQNHAIRNFYLNKY